MQNYSIVNLAQFWRSFSLFTTSSLPRRNFVLHGSFLLKIYTCLPKLMYFQILLKDFVRNVHLEDVWANTDGPLLFTWFGGRRKCGVWWAIMTRFYGPARWELGSSLYDKQRVLTPGHQGWNDLHSLCRIGMEYYLLNNDDDDDNNNNNDNNDNRKWQDYVYIQCEYKSTKQKIKHNNNNDNNNNNNNDDDDEDDIIYWIMMIIIIIIIIIIIMMRRRRRRRMTMMIIGTTTMMIMIIIITTTLTMTIMKMIMINTAQTPCQSPYKDRRI